jgi:hypothetical protein
MCFAIAKSVYSNVTISHSSMWDFWKASLARIITDSYFIKD